MPTDLDITIYAGADLAQDLDATTSTKSYSVRVMDRWFRPVENTGISVEVKDASTITLSISADDSETLTVPPQTAFGCRVGTWGHYQITEDSGSVKTRLYHGRILLSRNKAS